MTLKKEIFNLVIEVGVLNVVIGILVQFSVILSVLHAMAWVNVYLVAKDTIKTDLIVLSVILAV